MSRRGGRDQRTQQKKAEKQTVEELKNKEGKVWQEERKGEKEEGRQKWKTERNKEKAREVREENRPETTAKGRLSLTLS